MEEEWLLFGDKCSKIFHQLLRARANRTTICEITDVAGLQQFGQEKIVACFEQFFMESLGSENSTNVTEQALSDLPFSTLSGEQAELLSSEVTEDEIKEVFMNFKVNKSPGPDGWNAKFFRDFWGCIGGEVV